MSALTKQRGRVFVGLSGGVDSAVSAALLQQQGYDVTAAFMKNWSGVTAGVKCPWEDDLASARAVAAKLGLPLKIYDFEADYRATVAAYLIETYQAGLTPNPDIMCNEEIKFKAFFEKCVDDGAEFIATGHYARVDRFGQGISLSAPPVRTQRSSSTARLRASELPRTASVQSSLGRDKLQDQPVLKRGRDRNKDQSYFLYRVAAGALARTLLPIGELTKPEVRIRAGQFGLPNAARPDSQGLCFVGPVPMKEFLHEFIEYQPGEVRNEHGQVLGQHDGVFFYTIGQRHGLGIGGGRPYFVYDKDVARNILFVTAEPESNLLNKTEFEIADCVWRQPLVQNNYTIQTRYRAAGVPGKITPLADQPNRYRITLEQSERAVTPGQSAVLYDGAVVVGGGIIT